ncbi:cilia- and flagella-associated protein 251-like [Apis laboriosa]|uniref:cilia- and flagella-associated protein 251-like n=1 Tax=Apis laboriosa TaxID=183418 RepID=UPI001CC77454|nr:cilia- and flagella-associated protein 251-like [Apis laboriosa]XP_043794814.1 cilia- and flagella-associated protein 251-like [Apis laboriosa]XP_043794815.1 cilia- and flagella-associated protein 251-like [Apis laboriosa]
MERLYAVPSEQLRVWLIWLSKVGDMADEWHKWLRSHIDFVLRLSIELRAAEEILILEKKEEEPEDIKKEEEVKVEAKVETKVETKEIETNTKDDIQEETKEETKEETTEETKEETKEDTKEDTNEDEKVEEINNQEAENPNDDDEMAEEEKERDEAEVPAEELEEKPKLELIMEEEEEEKKEDLEEKRREEEERETEDVEEPVVTEVEEKKEDEVVEEEEEKPSIVITEEVEEEQIIIKEWPVGIPWEHLGIEEEEEKPFNERLPIPKNEAEMKDFLRKFTHEATIHRSSFKHWKDTADQAVKEIGNRLVMATFLVQGKDPSGEVKKPVPKKVPSKPKKIKSVQKKAKKKKVASPARKTNGEPEETEDTKMEMTSSKRNLEIRKMLDIDADDLVKDSARGMEPLPYFFYLKVEPDIDIAIEHDDEKVILADTERENITGDYQRLYFNLSDKPCKGGKPWIL